MLIGFVAGWVAVDVRPDLRASLVPPSLFDEMARGQISTGVQDAPFAAAFIIQNNIRVALICFAGGVFLGIPTAFVLLSNGWMLGTVAAAVRLGGYDFQFWSLIVPHGVLELSVIVISGGTGLMLGDAILRPGQLRRGEALARVARRAVLLVLGAASLLVIAGTLEAFVSPSGASRRRQARGRRRRSGSCCIRGCSSRAGLRAAAASFRIRPSGGNPRVDWIHGRRPDHAARLLPRRRRGDPHRQTRGRGALRHREGDHARLPRPQRARHPRARGIGRRARRRNRPHEGARPGRRGHRHLHRARDLPGRRRRGAGTRAQRRRRHLQRRHPHPRPRPRAGRQRASRHLHRQTRPPRACRRARHRARAHDAHREHRGGGRGRTRPTDGRSRSRVRRR